MRRTWTIIGVADVPWSFKWYQSLLGLPEAAPAHDYFGQIMDSDGTVLLCLHKWGAHEHPSLTSPYHAEPGNGLLLFFRVDNFDLALPRARTLVSRLEEEPHVNPSTGTAEFSLRGLLKNLGLVIGRAKFNVFATRAEELIEDRPQLIAVIGPLLKARKAIEQQTDDLDRQVLKLARYDAQVRRFMTVPGVGPITALCFKATIDDPTRFKRSRSVGAYVGLTTRRHASGEIDWTGRISKCGDAMLRSYLFEAAGVLLTRVPKWSVLKAWGMRLAKRNGLRKAKVAVARKLAVILHRMWIDGTEFNWSKKEVAA